MSLEVIRQAANPEGRLILHGRVRDASGCGVPGAAVIVFLAGGEREKPVGQGYCDRDGWYTFDLPAAPPDGGSVYRVLASKGAGRAGEHVSGLSWQGEAGRLERKKISIECRVINYSLLSLSSSDGRRKVSLEAIPETVMVNCAEDEVFNNRTVVLYGRGYVRCGQEGGEGTFSLTVCGFKDVNGGELLRLTVNPRNPGDTGLRYDTGGLIIT